VCKQLSVSVATIRVKTLYIIMLHVSVLYDNHQEKYIFSHTLPFCCFTLHWPTFTLRGSYVSFASVQV
jgi:hypothetical protein